MSDVQNDDWKGTTAVSCPTLMELSYGSGARLRPPHLSDGHVVLHVTIVLQKKNARRERQQRAK